MMNTALLQEFTALVNQRKNEILELQTLYLLKQIENELVQERFNICRNLILSKHAYYAEHSFTRGSEEENIAAGDRIMDCANVWLMTEADFDEYQQLCIQEYVKDNLTDADGRYTDEGNTENQLKELKEKLIKIGVDILPADFPNKNLLIDAIAFRGRKSYETREKFFELIMKLR